MKIVIATIALVAAIAVHSQDDIEFKMNYYSGLQQNGVITINYENRKSDWPRQPHHCYGILINWQKAIVPCSCVGYTNDREMASAWSQASHSTKIKAISPSDITVGLMTDEHSGNGKTERVGVESIKLHSKCDATFQVDFALLGLSKKLSKSRLIWVNSPHYDELKKQINAASLASAVSDECKILKWTKSILEPGASSSWEVQQLTVKFQHWHLCLPLVCPEYLKDGTAKYKPKNYKECFNKVEGNRYCLSWTHSVPLCDLVPGTPVFCSLGIVSGIMGITTNFTTHCNYSRLFNGVMAAFDDAMELAHDHLRVRNSEFYSELRIKEHKPKPELPDVF